MPKILNPSYAKNKIHMIKYVETHRDQINDYQKEYKREHKEKFNNLRMEYYYYKRSCDYDCEVKRLMSIKI